MRAICQKTPFLLVFLMLISCSSIKYHSGLEPVSPPVSVHTIKKVDSLQPTLVWKDTTSGAESYDLIIYTGILIRLRLKRGVRIYYREGIKGTSHKVEQTLEPKSYYVWSVRMRTGTEVGQWATYDWKKLMFGVPTGHWGKNTWWQFWTPKK